MNDVQNVRMHGASNHFLIHFGDMNPKQLLHHLNGADGLLVIQNDEIGDAYMQIFNADGSEAEQCGNGLRCVALHLVRSKLVESPVVTIRTRSGVSRCVVDESCNEVTVSLCTPNANPMSSDAISDLICIDLGNPNAVYWTTSDPIEERQKRGELLSTDSSFPEGMNVHFARRDAEQYATVATWERGVGPTHASGTGGAAVFVTSGAEGPFFVSSQGGTLRYEYDAEGGIEMTGPASYV